MIETQMKVEYVNHMGDDNSVVNAARVSLAKEASNYTDEQNHNLIKFLARNMHVLPFTHSAITLRIKAPIPIRTQCFKHKVGFVENEVSRRYVSDEPELFVPTFRSRPDGSIKQGSGNIITELQIANRRQMYKKQTVSQQELQAKYNRICNSMISHYNWLVEHGVSPEQARFILPQGVMTEWIWTGSLLAYTRFYNLRTDSHAQQEIQELAKMVGEIIKPLYPVSWVALTGDN